MNTSGFDAFTKRLAGTRLSLRRALCQVGAGGLAAGRRGGATVAPPPASAEATPAASAAGCGSNGIGSGSGWPPVTRMKPGGMPSPPPATALRE